MTTNPTPASAFRPGDEIVLTTGSHQGITGVFVRFHDDRNWADIDEHGGTVCHHPVAWMAPAGTPLGSR